jgi:hypothetical protein
MYVRCPKTGCRVLDSVASSAITRLACAVFDEESYCSRPRCHSLAPGAGVFGRSHAYLVSPSTCQDRMLVDILIFELNQEFIDYRIGESVIDHLFSMVP